MVSVAIEIDARHEPAGAPREDDCPLHERGAGFIE